MELLDLYLFTFYPPALLSPFLFSALLSSPVTNVKFNHCAIHCLPTYCVMQIGFVNSLAFAKSGKFLLAGVGQVICLHSEKENRLKIVLFFRIFFLPCL
jgi:hypothetical protein